MAFFGGRSITAAFIIADNKKKIAKWFTGFSEHPENYGIEERHRESMSNVVIAINKFIEITAPFPFFDDPGVPEQQRVAAPEIKYRDKEVLIKTIFDVIGWVLSVVGTAPGRPSQQNRANYYHPLLTLYAVMCRTLLKPHGVVVLPLLTEPGTIQVTWFQEGEVWRVALGGNLDKPLPVTKLKTSAKNDRANQMLAAQVITYEQYKEVNLNVKGGMRFGRGQSFGHCAETLPFTFIQWIGPDDKIKSNIGGISAIPGMLLGGRVNIGYDDAMKRNFTLPNSNSTLLPPCHNCSRIVKERFGGEKALSRFQPPRN